jgi:hypothetical protein
MKLVVLAVGCFVVLVAGCAYQPSAECLDTFGVVQCGFSADRRTWKY